MKHLEEISKDLKLYYTVDHFDGDKYIEFTLYIRDDIDKSFHKIDGQDSFIRVLYDKYYGIVLQDAIETHQSGIIAQMESRIDV